MYNPYAVGRKVYGAGRDAPNVGPTLAQGAIGYAERDAAAKTRRNAVLRRMQKAMTGQHAHPDVRRWQ